MLEYCPQTCSESVSFDKKLMSPSLVWDESESRAGQSDERISAALTGGIATSDTHTVYQSSQPSYYYIDLKKPFMF